MEKLNQCPCCDYFTLPSEQDHEICPICFWEDEYFGVEEPETPSGANHGFTIREARANFSKFGACTPEMVKNVLPVSERTKYVLMSRTV